jgi:SAM-dependent methyltransferase
LREGDALMLPCREGEFDAVLALGVLERQLPWPDAVRAWSRAVRPGGVVVFDALSGDNRHAVAGSSDALSTSSAVNVAQLVDFARVEGLTLKAVVPWGAFLGGARPNAWLRPLEQTHRWQRLLSWFAGDDPLLELGLFLELAVVAHLHPFIAGQLLVVVERTPDVDGTHERLTRRLTLMETALRRQDIAAVEQMLPVRGEELRKALERLLTAPRARMLRLDEFLPESTRVWCEHTWVAGRADASLMGLLDRWAAIADPTSLQPGMVRMLGYPLASRILPRLPREQP